MHTFMKTETFCSSLSVLAEGTLAIPCRNSMRTYFIFVWFRLYPTFKPPAYLIQGEAKPQNYGTKKEYEKETRERYNKIMSFWSDDSCELVNCEASNMCNTCLRSNMTG